jgi:hypothetical protein
MYRVISLRGLWPHKLSQGFIYLGRPHAGLPGHELANPFRGERALLEFAAWLHALPDLAKRLQRLRAETECGRFPLACWCGYFAQGDPPLPCHAYIVAQAMIERFPEDMKGGEW